MTIPKHIFREYDVRGLAGIDLTSEFAEALAVAYAVYFKKNVTKLEDSRKKPLVSVGRDCRLSSDEYAEAVIRGLLKSGFDVIDLGVCPTPLTYFSVFHLNLDGAIMITGSHNPAEYNGFKICLGKGSLHGSQIQDLRKIMESHPKLDAAPGTLSSYGIIDAYIDFQVSKFPGLKNKKIVLDAGNGTASTVAPILFERLGATVIPLYCELDGRFPNHHPDPTVPENLKVLIETVKREKADFGVGFDGDSDRIGVVDERGNVIYGDELMIIYARDVLAHNPGATIISEVKSSHKLYQDIAKNGGVPIMWKTGHSLIKSKMKESKALLAGEMSGHIFFADRYFGYDDAIYGAIRLYEIVQNISKPASSLLADLPKTFNTPEIRVDCPDEHKFQIVARAKELLSKTNKINDIDGVRIETKQGWCLIRASNTQPVLVLRFEAESENYLAEMRSMVDRALEQAKSDVQR
ncbi:MAG: phosphomannomutase/phosphoglucomutase [Xanthomonadaceae bacterium]|nr:phosphomannomutase/phosphoglucomutase [Xanthomonadaceae bacterium]